MIGKAKSISHGINDIRYITGESRNKKHPERIFHVGDNLLPPGLDATGIWDSMRLTLEKSKRVKNSVIRIEVSPAPEHTKDFTIDDWQRLWDDFTDEFDNIELLDKNGKTYSPKTALKGSKGTVWLHLESKSGIPHLHGAFCRIDERGNINNDHDIHLRAQRAAERVALKRGWTTAAEVRETNIGQVNRDCMETLQSMESWSWDEYVARLRSKGYEFWELRDNKKILRGYVLKKGNARYKASELGRGRNLMATKLESTWKKLHAAPKTRTVSTQPAAGKSIPTTPRTIPVHAQGTTPVPQYTGYRPGTSPYHIDIDGESRRFFIPDEALDVFNDEFDYRETANSRDLTDMAAALFVGMLDTPAVPSGGGGGSSNDLPWGRREDEDEREWARRCAREAARVNVEKLENRLSEALPKMDGAVSSLRGASTVTLGEEARKTLEQEGEKICRKMADRMERECARLAGRLSANDRVLISATAFWCMVEAIISLAAAFVCTCAANARLIHSILLWEVLGCTAAFLVVCVTLTIFICRKLRRE